MSFRDILKQKSSVAVFARDILLVLLIVGGIGLLLYGVAGTWPALVAVESGSMEPNITTYSLVFVVDENRFGEWMTQAEANTSGAAEKFNWYGDVIVYQPNGKSGVTPIIHRAITTISDEEALEWGYSGEAAHGGVITKGDNPVTNSLPDQMGSFPRYGISRMEPVKEEWIVGKALFAIPFAGWVPLHLVESIVIVAAGLVVFELGGRFISKRRAAKKESEHIRSRRK